MNKLFYLSDDEIQSQLAAKCNLLVHIGFRIFQFAVVDTVRDQVKLLAEYELPGISNVKDLTGAIESLPESSGLFRYSFNKVRISYDTFSYTFIPEELYSGEDEPAYAGFLQAEPADKLLKHHIRQADIKNIAFIDQRLYQALSGIFHKPEIYNQASPFIEGIKAAAGQDKSPAMFIDFRKDYIQIAVLDQLQLSFYNIFECVNADEFNYYLLSALEASGSGPSKIRISLSGDITGKDENFERISKYFTEIHFTDSKQLVKYPGSFTELAPHRFFSLLALDLCG